MSRDITVEVDLPYPPATVWLALTDPAALAERLMPVEVTEVDDGTRLRLDHNGFTGVGGMLLQFMHRSGWRKIIRTRLAGHLGSTV